MADKEDLISEATSRYTQAEKYWKPFFANARRELDFVTGKQWDSSTEALRLQEGRPCLTLNRVGSFLRNLSARNREKVLKVQAVSDFGELSPRGQQLNSVLRKILRDSNYSAVVDAASTYQIATGLGFLRVRADYTGTYSFDQDLCVESIDDPSSVLMDPACKDPLFRDARFCFVLTRMDKDEYLSTIGASSEIGKLAKLSRFSSHLSPLILDKSTIVVAEYYRRVPIKRKLVKYADPGTGEVRILDAKDKDAMSSLDSGFVLVNERTVDGYKILHSLFDGVEFHETTELEGFDSIPVFPLLGERITIDGKPEIFGAVRHAMDAQRLLNYAISLGLEVADLQAKSPWVAEDASMVGFEDIWRTANERNYSVLPYKKGTPAPTRNTVNTDISALMGIKTEAGNDIQNIFGIFDLQQGAPSSETSGVAILAKNNAANKSTFIFRDNLTKTTLEVGKVLAKAIPYYYNGRPVPDQNTGKADLVDIPVSFEPILEVVETDEDETKKQQTNTLLVEIVRASPSLAPILADLIVSNSDLEGAEEVTTRLQAMLPPQVQAALAKNENVSPEQLKGLVAGLQQQLQQGQMDAQKAQQDLQKAQQELAAEKASTVLEQAKIELEARKSEMSYDIDQKKLLLEEAKLRIDTSLAYHNLEMSQEKLQLEAQGIPVDELDLDTSVGE